MEALEPTPTVVLPQQVLEDQSSQDASSKQDLAKHFKVKVNKKESLQDSASAGVDTSLGLRYLFNGYCFLGINAPKKHKTLYIIWSIIVNLYVTVYLPNGSIIGFIKGFKSGLLMGDLLTTFQALINVIGCSIKLVLMGFLLPSLKNCRPIIERLDKRCSTAEQRALVHRFVRDGNRFVVLFAMSNWTYSSTTCISAVIFHRLPFNIYNPFVDATKSWGHFILSVLMEMVCMDIACFQQVVDDAYAVIYVNMLRTHLEALMIRIQRINTMEGENMDLEENLEELKLFIIDHKNIIDLYNRVAPIISITVFVQFTITATLLCVTLVNIMFFASNPAAIVASCFYIFAVVVEVFPLCYYAQCLTDESDRMADIIFHSSWVDQNSRYRQLLIFFMQRSQKTLKLTAGKIFPITLSSFVSIAKFSFSLYTLIKGMDIKERYGLS